MKKLSIAIIALTAVIAGPAVAADMPVKAPMYNALVPEVGVPAPKSPLVTK